MISFFYATARLFSLNYSIQLTKQFTCFKPQHYTSTQQSHLSGSGHLSAVTIPNDWSHPFLSFLSFSSCFTWKGSWQKILCPASIYHPCQRKKRSWRRHAPWLISGRSKNRLYLSRWRRCSGVASPCGNVTSMLLSRSVMHTKIYCINLLLTNVKERRFYIIVMFGYKHFKII